MSVSSPRSSAAPGGSSAAPGRAVPAPGQAQLVAAKTLTTDLQAKLDKAESQLALLQKPAKK